MARAAALTGLALAITLGLAGSTTLVAVGPSETTLDGTLLARALDSASKLPRLHSLLVARHGETVVERYFNGTRPTRLANIKSASKSIISALVGIAIDRGFLDDVHQPIGAAFADLLDQEEDSRKAAITIEDLLTMRSGLETTSNRNYGAWVLSKNWVRHALTRTMESEPGRTMRYSTGNTHLLSALLTRETSDSTWQFAQRVLAKPLGFSLARWPRDPQGIYFGGNDMLLTPRHMLTFGNLYLNAGRWEGKQVVPASWIAQSLVPRTKSRWSGRDYGYGWWIRRVDGRQIFYAWGYGGQYIFVVPSLQMVMVTTSSPTPGPSRRGHNQAIHRLLDDLLIPAAVRANRERTGNGEWGMGNGEWGMGNAEWGMLKGGRRLWSDWPPTTTHHPPPLHIPVQRRLHGGAVTAAKQVDVHQQRIQLVESHARQRIRPEGIDLVVGLPEVGSRTPEEPQHRQIDLSMATVHGRVDQARLALVVDVDVPTPEIAMQPRRGFLGPGEAVHSSE